ncbi:IPT/TIG domain-containing protein [Niastella populi]|uniref:IPT/TIG domain-containing protein n=1 Tax=Niastella populi TaxID=550983 RepID=A0A1V9FK63_9BACT|nr:T9SS type A sorting domain-containing protein [Niastella populi]OQP58773.1 hypothetical protein A4R26_22680 [Niastella populi]
MKQVTRSLPVVTGITFVVLLFSTGWQRLQAQVPAITNFTPTTGTVGTPVTITGSNFSNLQTLTIGGVNAVPVSNDGTTLVAIVMPGATAGSVVVGNADGTATAGDPFTLQASGSTFTQQNNKLVGAGNVGNGQQGHSVSISADGNTAIVGAPSDNSNQGAAWIFTRTGTVWAQEAKLAGTGATGAAKQGYSVAISADGNTVLMGGVEDNSGMGATWVFNRNAGVWSQQGSKLVGTGGGATSWQGCSVALSADGNTAVVGGYQSGGNQGGTWVFTRNAGVWTQQGSKLFGTGAVMNTAGQGYSVAISGDGNTILTGGYMDGWAYGTAIGAAWVFTRAAGVWTQQGAKLTGAGYVAGNVAQGSAVALSADGNTALIGGYSDNNNKGAAWVFTRSAGVWAQQGGKLVGTITGLSNPQQGYSVSLSADGNTALVGGWQDANVIGGGMWVFKRSGGNWAQAGSRLNGYGNTTAAYQGRSVAVSADGSTAIMGGHYDAFSVGAAWIFTTDPVALPLYWLSVDAQVIQKKEVKISWSTTEEVNTSHFEIQRSSANEQYKTIGTVQAAGQSNTVNTYTLTDKNIFTEGTYYYRIKQVDLDGKFSYSPVKTVRLNAAQESATWQVYPNPVKRGEPVNITAIGGGIQPGEVIGVQLTNAAGQTIARVKDALSNVAKPISDRISALTSGVYTMIIMHKGERKALQFIIQ